MLIHFFYIFFIFAQFNFVNNISNNLSKLKDEENKIEPGISKTYFIESKEETNFIFGISGNDNLQINIHGINCNFQLDFMGELINKINLDTYSIQIKSDNKKITIKPLLDVIDGQYKENYQEKFCPISINSFLINDQQPKLKIKNKENNIFYFDNSKFDLLNISYKIKELSIDSFATLSFQFNQKSHFFINITYINDNGKINNNTKNKTIENSTNIFLNSEFLLFDKESKDNDETIVGGTLNIQIINIDKNNINMHFRIIEKNTISLLEKDALTFGFLTSKTTYQYYYTQIFKGEEGELMLPNKI